MTKKELVKAILEDMYKKSGYSKELVDLTWEKWLNRQHKFHLEEILENRTHDKWISPEV